MILLLVLKNKIKNQISLMKTIEFLIEDGMADIELKLIGVRIKIDFCKQYVKENNLAFINSSLISNND